MTENHTNQKILEALHIDGRASWQRIAEAIDENERTVARRGNAMLKSGTVRIVAFNVPAHGFVLSVKSGLGQTRMASLALGKLETSMWVHLTTGTSDIVGAVGVSPAGQEEFLLDEMPAIPGIAQWQAYPVLSYLRTARIWRPGVLTSGQRQMLMDTSPQSAALKLGYEIDLAGEDAAIRKVLQEDGRQSYDEIARQVGTSVATVRRRLDRMRRDGRLQIRAVVAPLHLGLDTEIIMWLRVRDSDIAEASHALEADEAIKYAVRVAGDWTYVLKFDVIDQLHVDDFLGSRSWIPFVRDSSIAVVVATTRRNSTRRAFGEG
ncbi:Lrp/AsnC family transcriptional regulator [Brevibacterium sp. ZH18]|uniref:Lrp/AsnC family transcriptional regulator n=1 Tax=Brevibacterium sp. ZH18 TaxID=2927784 RepID=UPI001F60CF48|nr:Lrp/AsnC family transcriptional regulator [Brevibacterium sp. ZH18]MCI4011113.1 Lrp/AsnC family transcriptional regulator [Brevibacterium sp. ZH18]